MISSDEALQRIEEHTQKLAPVSLYLRQASGMVLASDVHSPINLPPFRNSAMDGYALILNDKEAYEVVEEVQAGKSTQRNLRAHEVVRVYTGSPLPQNADTVIIQEWATQKDNKVAFDKKPQKHANIRSQGEQLKVGELVFKKGKVLNDASIGLLAGLGISKVSVYARPKVGILVTGNELQQCGEPLNPGCIYESNSIMLEVALRRTGIEQINFYQVHDNLNCTKREIEKSLQENDLTLITGGVSVGNYDFVKQALEAQKVQEIFYKIRQKPGKPLWFGQRGDKTVFALPGNPASSLICFYVYVLPVIRKMIGKAFKAPLKVGKIAEKVTKTKGKTHFQRAKVEDGQVYLAPGQSSSMLHSFSFANALVHLPEDLESIPENGEVSYIALNTCD